MANKLALVASIIGFIVIGAIIVLDAPGNEAVDAFEAALEEYKASPSKKAASELVSVMPLHHDLESNALLFGTQEDEEKRRTRFKELFFEAQLVTAQNSHWEALANLDQPFGFGPFSFGGLRNEAKEILRSQYTGNNPELLDIVGRQALQSGELHEAYSAWAKAGLADKDMAAKVRGLAFQYGCTDLDRIWGELTEHRLGIGGDPLPPNEGLLNHHQLTKARMALRKGELPTIPEQCPINPGAET